MQTLKIATYNIHKGLSFSNKRLVIHELRERLRTLGPDLVFLQEVHGAHDRLPAPAAAAQLSANHRRRCTDPPRG